MFTGLFKFSGFQMWCLAYSFNHRIISTFNQLKITGWHQRFRIEISEIHQDHSPQPVVESKPDHSRFENTGIRKLSVPHLIFQTWIYFRNLHFPHTTGYYDKGQFKAHLNKPKDCYEFWYSVFYFLCIRNVKTT